jgi:hypothetical protein
MYRRITFALMLFGLAGCAAYAQGPQLNLPDFDHLRGKATQTVDLSLGSFVLFLAGRFIDADDPDSAVVKDLLEGVSRMHVLHYEFADDFVYSASDLEAVRAQLAAQGWSTLARVRDRKKQENVDICIAIDKEKITGLAIVATEPREFTIINVVGRLDVEKVAALREKFASDYGSSLQL